MIFSGRPLPELRARARRLFNLSNGGRIRRGWLVVTTCVFLGGCATLPDRIVETYGITQAHAVTGGSVLRLSHVGFNSFVFGQEGHAPHFSQQPAVTLKEAGILVRVYPSSRLGASGFDGEAATMLAGYLVRAHHSALPRYVGRPVPVERFDVRLLHPSERVTDRGRSFSLSQRHRLRFAFAFDPRNEDRAMRGVVRTAAHELLHVSLAVHGRRNKAGLEEEQAAYAIEHCVELDLFGDTSAPVRKSVVHDTRSDAVMTSLAAGHVGDLELEAAFHGQPSIATEQADALHSLCLARVRSLAGYPFPDHP